MSDDPNTGDGTPTPPATPPTTPPASPPTITSLDQIPQHLRTQLEMGHKKQLRSELDQARAQLQQMQQLKEQAESFMGLLGERGMSFNQDADLEDVAGKITGTLDSMKTEAERLTLANQAKDKQLAAAQAAAEKATTQLHTTLAKNVLMSHLMAPTEEGGPPRASGKKHAEVLAEQLLPYIQVDDQLNVAFEMETADEHGHIAKRQLDANGAIGTLEADADWSDFFSATRNGGAGGNTNDDGAPVHPSNMALDKYTDSEEGFAEFQDMMDKNPRAFEEMYDKLD